MSALTGDFIVQLIGPGGAGKTTAGALLAARLGVDFVDLDRAFTDRFGDISGFINERGYDTYARQNVETCCTVLKECAARCVIALSSGFMTYPANIHPSYAALSEQVIRSATTFVLVPSLHEGDCIAETVRRQMARPFARTLEAEEAAIRARFSLYVGLPVRKIETMRPIAVVVDEIATAIGGEAAGW